ncbi:hypothetical protein [Bradyrhizobium sp.]|jgi:hypothetical protein|uniref:hypothetical protein n=1 Tax=Bradyrhizobium sp. TaxID=376 RepID=UPI002E03690F|nr:hypothetical protein [Bradyrhizobium sp.]
MPYSVPGKADQASQAVIDAWNAQIKFNFDDLWGRGLADSKPYFIDDPGKLTNAAFTDAVRWSGAPAEPRTCLDETWAQRLSDWGERGRTSFQNEYLEYTLIYATDQTGKVRPKRFTATTELAEYWTTVASVDPVQLRAMAKDVLGRDVSYAELYGSNNADPTHLSPATRRIAFATQVAGNGQHDDLKDANVPANPIGSLNRENALFMRQPINGLDDLVYIVMFGARPYAVNGPQGRRRAENYEIFRSQQTDFLACRNADPHAARGAYNQVISQINGNAAKSSRMALADPLGMYIRGFNSGAFTWNGAAVPQDWIRWRRGGPGMWQRLEFGPPDDSPAFLDDIMERIGATQQPVSGGYRLVRGIEVGPGVMVEPASSVNPQWIDIPAAQPLDCTMADVCTGVALARADWETEHTLSPVLRLR